MTIRERNKFLKEFKGLILDGDGVWFTGEEYRGVLPDGTSVVIKPRHLHDGQGLSFLRALGIKVLFATSEDEPLKSVIKKLNALPSAASGAWEPVLALTNLQKKGTKAESIEEWLRDKGLAWADCAYIGDDRTDLEGMKKSGLSVTPGNGRRLIKKIAHIVLTKPGGQGAIREFAEMVLDARGIDEAALPPA